MGTNYYMMADVCPNCGHSDERVHVGKSSAGWVFALHVYPDDGINTWADWYGRLSKPGVIIENEYGERISLEAMVDVVGNRAWPLSGNPREAQWLWYAENHAEPGPKGLARSKIDGRHCIGHGEGTWSYYVGDFS